MSRQPRIRLTRSRGTRHAAGFTLIELMVAMVLGLIVIAGVTSVFLAGQQSFRTNNALADVEDGSRIAFELMARDIREAGLYGCDNSNNRLSNVLNNGSTLWYADWGNALHGYDDASTDAALTGITSGKPIAGQPSLHILSAGSITASVSGAPSSAAANLNINQKSDQLQIGDIIIVCSLQGTDAHATMLQITNFNNNNIVVVHNSNQSGTNPSPGNCSKGLGYPPNCSSAVGNGYVFPPNSPIAKLTASDWYIGTNAAGGASLYRLTLSTKADGSGVSQTPQEIVRNVCLPADDPSCVGMQITYHAAGASSYVDAATIGANWGAVDSVRVQLSLMSTFKRASVNATPIVRTYSATTAVRNRVQ